MPSLTSSVPVNSNKDNKRKNSSNDSGISRFSIITGDETGLIKLSSLNISANDDEDADEIDSSKAFVYKSDQIQSRLSAVKSMDWINFNIIKNETDSQKNLAALRIDGSLDIWSIDPDAIESEDFEENTSNGSVIQLIQSIKTNIENPLGVVTIPTKEGISNNGAILCFGGNGDIILANKAKNNNLNDEEVISGGSYDSMQSLLKFNRFNVTGPLAACDACYDAVAFGGVENDLKLYDVNTMKQVWEARNVPHDKLSLRVPVWITSISFLQPSIDSKAGSLIATGTGHKHVRVYDTRNSNCRPITSIDCSEDYRVTNIVGSEDGNSVYISDSAGGISHWDVRTNRRMHTLHGFAGSVRDLKRDNEANFLAGVGLDRYLRIYDINKHKLHSTVYLKNRINACLVTTSNFENSNRNSKRVKKYDYDDYYDEETEVDGEDRLFRYHDSDDEEEQEDEQENSSNDDDDDEDDYDDDNQKDNNSDNSDDDSNDEDALYKKQGSRRDRVQKKSIQASKSIKKQRK
jgi:ribosome biogenesis protein NSA1